MKVTLTQGKYKPVCPCGGRYAIMTVARTAKFETYCWYCKQENGKFIKIMEEVLKFSYNWNNKLNCNSFTTLRLRNDNKYYPGAKVHIWFGNTYKGKATIVGIHFYTLDKINEFVARLDTGYSAEECREIIMKMYKDKPNINWATQQLAFCLVVYDKRANKPELFVEYEIQNNGYEKG